ncbi:hypothetical protein Q8A73_018176 [Channa argus]|nr:hypothetical protein Q8A73_018176 [Channa argus]
MFVFPSLCLSSQIISWIPPSYLLHYCSSGLLSNVVHHLPVWRFHQTNARLSNAPTPVLVQDSFNVHIQAQESPPQVNTLVCSPKCPVFGPAVAHLSSHAATNHRVLLLSSVMLPHFLSAGVVKK